MLLLFQVRVLFTPLGEMVAFSVSVRFIFSVTVPFLFSVTFVGTSSMMISVGATVMSGSTVFSGDVVGLGVTVGAGVVPATILKDFVADTGSA